MIKGIYYFGYVQCKKNKEKIKKKSLINQSMHNHDPMSLC